MFDSVKARYVLRAALFGVAATIPVVREFNVDGIDAQEAVEAGLVWASAALAYAGFGAMIPQIEPSIGNKLPASKR